MRLGLALAALGLLLPFALPFASAHCDGVSGSVVVLDRCLAWTQVEKAIDAANLAGDGQVAFIAASCQRFHPESVTIHNGGTVTFVWADALCNDQHDPRSSVSTGSTAADQLKPAPDRYRFGECFDVKADEGNLLQNNNPDYPLTFRVDFGTGAVQRANAILAGAPVVGEPPVAKPFTSCPAGNASTDGSEVVIPYHCGVHGFINTPVTAMRGSITVVP